MKYLLITLASLVLLSSGFQQKAFPKNTGINTPINEMSLDSSRKEKGKIKNGTYVCSLFNWNISIPKEFDIYYPVRKRKDVQIPLLVGNHLDENQLVSFGLDDRNYFSAYIKPSTEEKKPGTLVGIAKNSFENFVGPSRQLCKDLETRYSENREIAFKQNFKNEVINDINYNIYEIQLVLYPEEIPIVNQVAYVRREGDNNIFFSIVYTDEKLKESLLHTFKESIY